MRKSSGKLEGGVEAAEKRRRRKADHPQRLSDEWWAPGSSAADSSGWSDENGA